MEETKTEGRNKEQKKKTKEVSSSASTYASLARQELIRSLLSGERQQKSECDEVMHALL